MELRVIVGILLISVPLLVSAGQNLSLKQAGQIALSQAPELQQIQANARAYDQDAVADDQLDDPKLMLGAANVPTDSFSFTQENMTQIQIGLMQQFPKGSTLAIRSYQTRLKSLSVQSQKALMKLNILRMVRVDWLNEYYWQKAIHIYQKEKKVFQYLLDVHTKLLANNQSQQKDVVRAQFELSQLTQQILNAEQQRDEINSQLSRWLPFQTQQLRINLPSWANPPNLNVLQRALKHHPMLVSDQQNNAVSQQDIQLAKQQYKPGVNVGVVYGFRQGNDALGQKRSDFVGAQVTMDLPVFTHNRQSRRLNASVDRYTASKMQALSDYRQLHSQLLESLSSWRKLRQQYHVYRMRLVPEAKHYAEATQIAYQNKLTDFPTLAMAYVQSYNTELASLKTRIGMLQARVNLLYLQGR